jgi:hypothetical protein
MLPAVYGLAKGWRLPAASEGEAGENDKQPRGLQAAE